MAGRATRTPTRAEPKIGRPGGMPTISTVAQGGAQRSEQYLEAWTGEGASAARSPAGAGAIIGTPQGVALLFTDARAAQRERARKARAAIERIDRSTVPFKRAKQKGLRPVVQRIPQDLKE